MAVLKVGVDAIVVVMSDASYNHVNVGVNSQCCRWTIIRRYYCVGRQKIDYDHCGCDVPVEKRGCE